jgi:hypothetical protein
VIIIVKSWAAQRCGATYSFVRCGRGADARLDDTERAALVALLRAAIKNTRWPLAPRTKAQRAILDKLALPSPLAPAAVSPKFRAEI